MSHPIKTALISVSDKTHLIPFAQQLHRLGVQIISTGGTAKALANSGIETIAVSDFTGFPEIMGGRVKTLHPKIFAAILYRQGQDEEILETHQIPPIDLVVVNLYPFAQTIAKPDCSKTQAIEQIDIGGPSLIRAAAKNHASITVVTDPQDYDQLINVLQENAGCSSDTLRYEFAAKAFSHTASYDTVIAQYLHEQMAQAFLPETLGDYHLSQTLRYGENPHQAAAFYTHNLPTSGTIAHSQQHQGKALSYNNIADADTALTCVSGLAEPFACVIVKHANPCGVACGDNALAAYERAYATDPTSAFGGIIAFNCELDATCAQTITQQQFVEVVIAPSISAEALNIFANKPNLRVLSVGPLHHQARKQRAYLQVDGGLLVQDTDNLTLTAADLKVVSARTPSEAQLRDCLFAWHVCKSVKSNAIVYAHELATTGIGAGQMSRVFSADIAKLKAQTANLSLQNNVMASDAFFPFRDSIDIAAQSGVSAIIQPGGSIRDDEVIKAANEHHIVMLFTQVRHFRH